MYRILWSSHTITFFSNQKPAFRAQYTRCLNSLDWEGGMEWWNGIVECVLQGEWSLLMQFSMKVTVAVLFLIEK